MVNPEYFSRKQVIKGTFLIYINNSTGDQVMASYNTQLKHHKEPNKVKETWKIVRKRKNIYFKIEF